MHAVDDTSRQTSRGRPPLLTEEQQQELYAQYRRRVPRWTLARRFGVSQSTVNNIIRRLGA